MADEEWEMVEREELVQADGGVCAGAIYKDPSVRAAIQEYIDRCTPSAETKRNLQAAWTIVKMASEVGYAVVSEPVYDAADALVRKTFGVERHEDLPGVLRQRLMRALPQPTVTSARVVNCIKELSGGAVATSSNLAIDLSLPVLEAALPETLKDVVMEAREHREMAKEAARRRKSGRTTSPNRPTIEQPTISNDLRDEDDKDVIFIDELEGMNVGTA